MRALLVAVTVALAGCPHSSAPPPPGGGYDESGCKISCDKCPPQALCVGWPYVPACLVQCTTTADCNVGETCAIILNPDSGSVCITPASLTECHPVDCVDPPQCLDAFTQLKPLPTRLNACGWEPIHCDSGCDSATGSCK